MLAAIIVMGGAVATVVIGLSLLTLFTGSNNPRDAQRQRIATGPPRRRPRHEQLGWKSRRRMSTELECISTPEDTLDEDGETDTVNK